MEHTYADGAKRKLQTNPVKAIRDHCKHSCCQVSKDNEGSYNAWRNCEVDTCVLHPYRLGTNPHRKSSLTDEQRAERAERMRAMRTKEV